MAAVKTAIRDVCIERSLNDGGLPGLDEQRLLGARPLFKPQGEDQEREKQPGDSTWWNLDRSMNSR
jgi:hypothetical protein